MPPLQQGSQALARNSSNPWIPSIWEVETEGMSLRFWLLCQRTQVQFSAPTWQLTPVCNSSARASDTSHRHTCRQNANAHEIKINKLLNIFKVNSYFKKDYKDITAHLLICKFVINGKIPRKTELSNTATKINLKKCLTWKKNQHSKLFSVFKN